MRHSRKTLLRILMLYFRSIGRNSLEVLHFFTFFCLQRSLCQENKTCYEKVVNLRNFTAIESAFARYMHIVSFTKTFTKRWLHIKLLLDSHSFRRADFDELSVGIYTEL